MKTLNEYILESGGFFGNTKTSKNDLIMDWIYKFMPYTKKDPDSIEIKNGIINIKKSADFLEYRIGTYDGPALDADAPIKSIKFIPEYKGRRSYTLYYDCNIRKFDLPLDMSFINNVVIELSPSLSKPNVLKYICRKINACDDIKFFNFESNNKFQDLHKINFDYNCLKEFNRNFHDIEIPCNFKGDIKFNQNISVKELSLMKYNLKEFPKIITLPICKKIYLLDTFTYDEIIDMLSDYIPNPKMKDIEIEYWNFDVSNEKKDNIKNIILGKK